MQGDSPIGVDSAAFEMARRISNEFGGGLRASEIYQAVRDCREATVDLTVVEQVVRASCQHALAHRLSFADAHGQRLAEMRNNKRGRR